MTDNLRPIKDLLGYTFVIKSYQRGYRWSPAEVISLLEDIHKFDIEFQGFYSLQPMVVKELSENNYELIDGQQRLTTIWLILTYLKEKKKFQINYSTRGEDEGKNPFLEQIEKNNYKLPDVEWDGENEYKKFSDEVFKFWKNELIPNNSEILNSVENFYFFRSYATIKKWFDEKDVSFKEEFIKKLLDKTKVIWYEENKVVSSEMQFINFNQGRIALEQAELIKALYVLDILKNPNLIERQYKENAFATEWNTIEHHLQDKKFWQFITKDTREINIANKINLLFQLKTGKGKVEDDYFNYRKFEKAFNSSSLDEDFEWETFTELYNQLEEWFMDRATYHLVGGIIHLTNKPISEIIKLSNSSESKSVFRNKLRKELEKEFKKDGKWKEKYDPEKIQYGKKEVRPLLLLFNIALTYTDRTEEFFPFYRFYNVKQWEVEHILAQKDDGLESMEEFKNFHKEVSKMLEAYEINPKEENQESDGRSSIYEHIEQLEQNIENKDIFACKNNVEAIRGSLNEIFDIDNFSNLSLLDDSTNTKVGKRQFRDKRDIILRLTKGEVQIDKDTYIPVATELVFSKQSTSSGDFQIDFWGLNDREAYKEKFIKVVSAFLMKEE